MKDKAEPTLQDVIEIMQGGFERVEHRLDGIDQHLVVLDERLDNVEDSVRGLTRRVGSLEEKVDDMQETLEGIGRAVDKDAITILDHEQRIVRLESARA